MFAAFILTAILGILILFGIVSLISMQIARRSGAPFFPTPERAIRSALLAVKLKPGETFYDLGAGTGKAMLIAEQYFGARAVGFEISIFFYLIAKANLFLHRSHADLRFKNFFKENLGDAQVVFVFLAERTMAQMEKKLKAELKPGSRAIVYAFPFPSLKPYKIEQVSGSWQMFFYEL